MSRGKKPSVRYWESRRAYGCWIGGEQHILAKGPNDAPIGPTYLAAHARFRKLIQLGENKGTDDYLVSALLNQYRAHLRATRKSSTPGIFEVLARGFSEKFGHLKVCQLKPHDFELWLMKQDRWNPTSKAHAGRLILAAVAWARKKGLIETDPIAGRVDLPTPLKRGREARMSDELMDLLIAEARQNLMRSNEFAEFLWTLRLTGARPIEIRMAEAANYVKSNGCGRIVFRWDASTGYKWKNATKTQRDRVIYLTPELTVHVEKLIKANPTGPIFRTPRGATWSITSICNKWRNLVQRPRIVAHCKKHGVSADGLKPYFFRHSFLSRWVDEGGDIYVVAQLCGTSVKMVERVYGHPDAHRLHARYLDFMNSLQTSKRDALGGD